MATLSATPSTPPSNTPFPSGNILKRATSSTSCATCSEEFSSSEIQRTHMRSDYHVYNLKRRVAGLPPITSKAFDDFMRRESGKDEDSDESAHQWCCVCEKGFSNIRSYRGHLRSRRHAELVSESPDGISSEHDLSESIDMLDVSDSDGFEMVETDDEVIPTTCLFCNHHSSTLDENVAHMSKAHSLFIPTPERLLDLGTFIGYLNTLISEFHECLYCGAEKRSMEAVQHHMLAKGHCMISLEDVRQFYDFSSEDATPATPPNPAPHAASVSPAKIQTHRSPSSPQRQNLPTDPRPERKAIAAAASTDRAVTLRAVRGTSMLGVSAQRQRALLVAERTVLKLEIKARNVYQARLEKQANHQKHFRPDNPGRKLGVA